MDRTGQLNKLVSFRPSRVRSNGIRSSGPWPGPDYLGSTCACAKQARGIHVRERTLASTRSQRMSGVILLAEIAD